MSGKSEQAFRTIGELAEELGVPQHILRYWETRFTQLRPLQRAGNRRYYRPADVALAQRIHRLINQEGYTIRGVQRVLAQKGAAQGAEAAVETVAVATVPAAPVAPAAPPFPRAELRAVRDRLAATLAEA